MTVGSLFSGIGGFDLGLERAGMRVVWQVEVDPACARVLERHWPRVRRYGDIQAVDPAELETTDLVAGGFPCQDLSVAGRRAGLAGRQSSLYWEFHRIVAGLRPRWVLIENVPGLLSSNRGRDFKLILDSLVELGYGVAWRVLDAQYFGLAQRRKRVFLVGHLGAPWSTPAAVLLEPESLPGGSPPRPTQGQAATALVASGAGAERPAGIGSEADFLVPILEAGARTASDGYRDGDGIGNPGDPMFTLQARHQHAIAGTLGGCSWERGWADGLDRSGVFVVGRALTASMERMDASAETLVARPLRANRWGGSDSHGDEGNVVTVALASDPISQVDRAMPVTGRHGDPGVVASELFVRRLTPLECERLQGFPDGWTAFGADGKPISDSARYRMLGNAVAVAVARWIGQRIREFELQREAVHL